MPGRYTVSVSRYYVLNVGFYCSILPQPRTLPCTLQDFCPDRVTRASSLSSLVPLLRLCHLQHTQPVSLHTCPCSQGSPHGTGIANMQQRLHFHQWPPSLSSWTLTCYMVPSLSFSPYPLQSVLSCLPNQYYTGDTYTPLGSAASWRCSLELL